MGLQQQDSVRGTMSQLEFLMFDYCMEGDVSFAGNLPSRREKSSMELSFFSRGEFISFTQAPFSMQPCPKFRRRS